MTALDFKALRAMAVADGADDETMEFLENLWTVAPEKSVEGVLAAGFKFDMEGFVLLARLLKKLVPGASQSGAPPIVTVDEWPIMFFSGDLHIPGNLPLENTQVIVLGNLIVDGVIGSYRDFETTRLVVLGDLTCLGLEGDKEIFVDGTLTADIVWFEGKTGELMAETVEARVLYSGSNESLHVETIRVDHGFTAKKPVKAEAMQSVLAPEAFEPEDGYVFEGHPGYGCVNRALRLMARGKPGLLQH